MKLELRNRVSGESIELEFDFPGNVWQLKCRIAGLFQNVPLDGASRGVQLWQVNECDDKGHVEERLLTDSYEELEKPLSSDFCILVPSHSFCYLLQRRTTFHPWKDMQEISFSPCCRGELFHYAQKADVLEEAWDLKSFKEFASASSEYLLWEGQGLGTSWGREDVLVKRMLERACCRGVPEEKKCAMVARAGRDQVQEVLFYEHEGMYHMEGHRMPEFFWPFC